MKHHRRAAVVCLSLMSILAAPGLVHAQDGGVRAGVSGSPDQFYLGAHVEAGPVAEMLWFRPNVELGVGSDRTVVSFNVEFVHRLALPRSDWRLYVGGGPALNVVRTSRDTNPGGGLTILVGAEHQRGFFTELKAGLVDSPEIKFGVGYTFR
ncbi:MAG: hypothetical protein IT176_10445 [Acidobacteria bacterium]|nr:hypothetical protein [Acidobacteriota bacterium]